jgi:murein DD-endopeptidase MepM/ murein hydrolase activator NlpD
MLVALWTWSVRAVAVLTAGMAVAVIAMSVYAARAEAGPGPAPLGEVLGVTQDLQPVQAPPAAPAPSYAVPAGVLPATRASPLSSGSVTAEREEAQSLPARPLVAVLDARDGNAAGATVNLAALVQEALTARGYGVYVLADGIEGAYEPTRPDAYISLRPAAGGAASGAGTEAWFCELAGSLSGRLADLVLASLSTGLGGSQGSQPGQGNGKVDDSEGFRCDMLLAGRAQMPAVLLEIPSVALETPSTQGVLAQAVTDGVDRFLRSYGDQLLREEQRRHLIWPAVGPVTSFFGPSHPLGIDIGQWQGPIVAATDGIVTFAGGDPCCSYGLYVVIEGPGGITTLYAHFESLLVSTGQTVRQGQWLGMVGCTGHCYGNHLHFEVIDNGVRHDPLQYLP